VKRRDPKPGELRAIAVVEQLWRAADDPAARFDLSRVVSKLSPDAQRYVQLLIQEGARDDIAAAKALGLGKDAFEHAVAEVEAALRELA
jgi:hypothetical protein